MRAACKTLIDHIATANKSNIIVSDEMEISLSDHILVYGIRKFRGASKHGGGGRSQLNFG